MEACLHFRATADEKPRSSLLFCFLMNRRLFTPLAILLELDLAGDELAVLARPIVRALAHRTGEFEELVLGHTRLVEFRLVASQQSSDSR